MGSLPAIQPVNIQPPDIANALATRYQLQQMQQKQASQNALMQAGPGLVSGDDKQFQNSLSTLSQYDPQTALQLQSSHAAQKKAASDLQWDQLSKSAQVYGTIAQLPDDQIVSGAQQALAIAKSHGADTSQIEPIVASGDPNKIRQFATLSANISMTRAEQLKQSNDDRTFQAGRSDQASKVAHESAALAETSRHDRQTEAASDASALTPDAVGILGDISLTNGGNVPSFGMGGGKQKAAIFNSMAGKAKAQGITGTDIATGSAAFKANSAALSQITKAQTAIGSFEQTASQNADVALGLMNKGAGPTGSPIIDRWVRAGGKSVAGDADVSKFDTALTTFVNEYAKVMSGGYGAAATSDTMQAHARELLNPNMSKEQIVGNIQVMKQDMANRTQSLNDYRSNLIQHIHAGASGIYQPVTGSPSAPAAAPTAAGGAGAVGGAGWSIQKLP